jgi:RNA polymerase subunit RPABC4/transcription elongation factor Spt4
MDTEQLNGILSGALIYVGVVALAFWIGMILWTFRDMRARSRDTFSQIAVAALVALLNVPGFLLYLFLRPRETLADAYERSLEEEALLQDIEDKPTCPACKSRVHDDWQACPNCHTRLKKSCVRCGKLLEMSWDLCPYCTTPAQVYGAERQADNGYSRSADIPVPMDSPTRGRARARRAERLEFVDGEDNT